MAALSFQTMPASAEPGRFADVRRRDETDSTNTDLLRLARSGAPEGVVIVTDYQRSGRGRRGRAWQADPGSALLASVLLRPALAPRAAHLVAMAAGLAAADACAELAGVHPGLKWPNDLVIERAGGTVKLAGLLAESVVEGDDLVAVVVGMGCNLRATPARNPAIVEDRGGSATPIAHNSAQSAGAAFLEDLAGHPVDRDELLAAWLVQLDGRYPTPSGAADLVDDYRRRCTTLGKTIRVELPGETFEGQAVEVTNEGHLVVEAAAGRRTLAVADVVHLHPAQATGPVP